MATAASKPALRHDTVFWAAFLATSWLAIGMGFWRPIAARYGGTSDYAAPPELVIHVWSFFGWMTLLTVQVLLVARNRRDLHRRLGIAGMVLAPVVVVSGFVAEVYSQRFWARSDPGNIEFFPVPVAAVVGFAVFAAAALILRRDAPTHKRMILLATASVVNAGYSRWFGEALGGIVGEGVIGTWIAQFPGVFLVAAAAIWYDLATRGSVHRSLRVGVPLLLAIDLAAAIVWHVPGWPELGRQLLDIPPPA